MKTQYYTAASLDGFSATDDDSLACGQFFDAGLLDELIVQVGSVTLGNGKPLFPRRGANPPLRLVSVRQVGTGFAELRYEVRRSDAVGAA